MVKSIRILLKLNQEQMAKKLGVSVRTIKLYEKNPKKLSCASFKTIYKLKRLLERNGHLISGYQFREDWFFEAIYNEYDMDTYSVKELFDM